jgi:hypothetical protein
VQVEKNILEHSKMINIMDMESNFIKMANAAIKVNMTTTKNTAKGKNLMKKVKAVIKVNIKMA